MSARDLIWRAAESGSIVGSVSRRLVRRFEKHLTIPLDHELRLNLGPRPNYTYCVYHAAALASRLKLKAISVIEFGVAGGNGLLFLDQLAPRIEARFGVTIELYGFDTGEGMPAPAGAEDLPYWFRASQYRMDVAAVRARIGRAQLVLGNVGATVADFFTKHEPAPVGAILNDLDYYSSTADSLKLFDQAPARFLPRVFIYFDDIVGSEWEMYSPCNGQLRAIAEFNAAHSAVYLGLNQNLLARSEIGYRYQIYHAHLQHHPLYASYIGGSNQEMIESALRLQASSA